MLSKSSSDTKQLDLLCSFSHAERICPSSDFTGSKNNFFVISNHLQLKPKTNYIETQIA